MDNYSPSHPTEESELAGESQTSEENRPSKAFNNEFDGVLKKLVSQIVEVKRVENESEKKIKNLNDDRESSEDKGYMRGSPERRARSDKRRRSDSRGRKGNSRGNRGRSRSRERRSRSRERRSRSRNRSGKKDSRSIKESRQSSDRRHDKIQRSPDTHLIRRLKSRSKSPFNKEFRQNIRRRDKNQSPESNSFNRSKSPFNTERLSSIEQKGEKNKRQYSSEKHSDSNENFKEQNISNDRESDNIFTKLTELRTLPMTDAVKEKWSYDSDEDINATKTAPPVHDNFSSNRGGFQNHDDRPFRGRQDFGDRRGRGSFRGFQRDSQWGQDRNDSFSNKDTRNQPWGHNRNESFNQRSTWGQVGQDSDNKSRIMNEVDQNKRENVIQSTVVEKEPPFVKKSSDADNSDDDFGSWGKKFISTPPNNLRIDKRDSDVNKNENNNSWSKNIPQLDLRENIEGGFAAWKNAQRTDMTKESDMVTASKVTEGSDEEYGNWGKETAIKSPIKGNMDKVSSIKVVNEDSDDEFGAWGSERKMTSSKKVDDFPPENQQNETQFQSDQRPPFQNRNNFNNNSYNNSNNSSYGNNQFGQRRGGPRNFNNGNRFQRPPNQDRTFNNQNNNTFPSNYNMNFNNAPQMQLKETIPPVRPSFNYNQSQWNVPPQQVSYPPIVGGKLPFALDTSICPPMGMVQQMQHPMMQQMAFIPPPPPNATVENRAPPMPPVPMIVHADTNILHQTNRNRQGINAEQINNINQPLNNIAQSLSMMDNGNLLEKLMTQAGLSSDSLRLAQEKKQDISSRSVGDTFSTILKSAATSVISRLVESSQKPLISDNMSMSPPSPPSNSPPMQSKHNIASAKSQAGFVPPPLPNYSDVLKPSINKITNHVKLSESSTFEDKRNRGDFESKNDWQERVALEVKTFLKPAYMSRSIDKNDYKEIMKRCVTKITRSGVTEINREKIEKFVLSYVDKYNKNRKTRQHSAVSSSEHDV